jgi:hypothetical protein
MKEWFDVGVDGNPHSSGTYLAVVRGKTSMLLMKFNADKSAWRNQTGNETSKVTHWFNIPSLPPALRENILIRKAAEEGLDDDEKLELAQLLRHSIKQTDGHVCLMKDVHA